MGPSSVGCGICAKPSSSLASPSSHSLRPCTLDCMLIDNWKPHVRKTGKARLLIYAALFLGYFVLKLETLLGGSPLKADDTSVYEGMAALPIWHPDFFAGIRPISVPLVYKLLDSSPYLVTTFQWALSLLTWG